MSVTPKLAIIGGSKEAIDLALALQGAKIDVCLFETQSYPSPSGINAKPYPPDNAWNDALKTMDAVIIAPHPFAFSGLENLNDMNIPSICLLRPEWVAGDRDNWISVPDAITAAIALTKIGASKPLLAVGRDRLEAFLDMESPELIVRCRNKPEPNLQGRGIVVFQPGPFTVAQENSYLSNTGIDCIVVHNAGGQGGWPKLEAARDLNIPVIMFDRPSLPFKTCVDSVDQVINWLRHSVSLDLSGLSE